MDKELHGWMDGWTERIMVKGSMLKQRMVMSSISQGPVSSQGAILHVCSNMESGIEHTLSKLPSTTNLCGASRGTLKATPSTNTGWAEVSRSLEEKDLEMLVDQKLAMSQQYAPIVQNANQSLG